MSKDTSVGIVVALVALTLLSILLYLRYKVSDKLEITLGDAGVLIALVAIWMLASGKITELAVGAEGIRVKSAILKASYAPIVNQKLQVREIAADLKGDVGQIPNLVDRQVEGLTFVLGMGDYNGQTLQTYLSELNKYWFFHYVIFINDDKSLFGMIRSHQLSAILRDKKYVKTPDELAELINTSNRERLGTLPGLVLGQDALLESTNKRQALEAMERRKVDWFPVVNDKRQLVGVVEESALAASLVLDVATRLEQSE